MKKQFRSAYPKLLSLPEGEALNYCGIRCSVEVLGGKWKLLVVASLAQGSLRFSEIKRSIPEISEKMLIRTLKDLEMHQIVLRETKAGSPPQVCYSLSAYGQSVLPLLRALFEWGEGHIQRFRELIFF